MPEARQCRGTTQDGSPCKNETTKPSGLCGQCKGLAAGAGDTVTQDINPDDLTMDGEDSALPSGETRVKVEVKLRDTLLGIRRDFKRLQDSAGEGHLSEESVSTWADNTRMVSDAKRLQRQLEAEFVDTYGEGRFSSHSEGASYDAVIGKDRASWDSDRIWKDLTREISQQGMDMAETIELVKEHRSAGNWKIGELARLMDSEDMEACGDIQWGDMRLVPELKEYEGSKVVGLSSRLGEFSPENMRTGESQSQDMERMAAIRGFIQHSDEVMGQYSETLAQEWQRCHPDERDVRTGDGQIVGTLHRDVSATGIDHDYIHARLAALANSDPQVYVTMLRSASRDSWKKTELANQHRKVKPGIRRLKQVAESAAA